MLIATGLSSNPFTAAIVAAALFGLAWPLMQRIAVLENSPWLVKILVWSFAFHLVCAPAQIFVVDHFYHHIADWTRYNTQGSILAPNFRSLNFTLAGANVRGIVNDGSVSIAAGLVMALVGSNPLAAFLVFSALAWVGSVFFYRAFVVAFPGAFAAHRRYAWMLFFMPSMIFWSADIGKEAIMSLSLGVMTFGAAKVLRRRPAGFTLLTLGMAIGILIRPNEIVVLMGAFAAGLMIRPASREARAGLKRVGGLLFMAALLALSVYLTVHYLFSHGGFSLNKTNANNNGTGAGFGSSGLTYSGNPLYLWRDFYAVLFDPLPFNAHGSGEYVAALENSYILFLFYYCRHSLRIVFRAAFANPFVMLSLVYTIGFAYAFASLGNLGLIARERTMLFPFLLCLLNIQRTPPGQQPRFDWEYKRKQRKAFREQMAAGLLPWQQGLPSSPRVASPLVSATAQSAEKTPASGRFVDLTTPPPRRSDAKGWDEVLRSSGSSPPSTDS